jgi:pimeloyl-ACP methyl ester carboxylesterase
VNRLAVAVLAAGVVLCGLMAAAWAQRVPGQTVVDLETRPGVTTRYLALAPARPKAAVLLFTGGQGVASIPDTPGPGWARNGNFLVRTRTMFRDRDLFVAIVDVPSDHRSGYGAFRGAAEHAEDVAAVIADMRKRAPGVPVWVIGTSRGTISAAAVAARLPKGKGPDGLVLTSSLTRPGGRNAGPGGSQTVFDFDLASVTMPVLVVHHREDHCFATPYADAAPLRDKFARAQRSELLSFSGGSPRESHECEPQAPHGFFGIEREVVDAIADWLLK